MSPGEDTDFNRICIYSFITDLKVSFGERRRGVVDKVGEELIKYVGNFTNIASKVYKLKLFNAFRRRNVLMVGMILRF